MKEGEMTMSKFREIPCIYYVCYGQCSKGRAAAYKSYCQHCDKYVPRVKGTLPNKKKLYEEKSKRMIDRRTLYD